VQALPRTQLTCVALFGLPGIEPLDIPQLTHLQAASRSFCSAIEISAHNNPRNQLISRLSSDTTIKLFSQKTCLRALNELLSAIIGTEIPSNLLDQLSSIQPDLKADSIEDVANLLGTVGLIDQGIAKIWVDAAGQQTLLERIYNEVPWVSRPELRHEEEGLAVCADVHCVAASCQPDTHSEVVHLCELLLAIAPQAELAISNAVSQDGEIAGYGDFQLATKRIPRKNLPPSALPDWNKRWRIAVADRVAAPSYTDYLSRAAVILRDLVATLENVLDEWFRKGEVSEANCERLNSNNNQAETLTPPRFSPQASTGKGSAEKNIAVTDLQSVLFDCSVNLIKRFNKLPEDANCYIAWTGGILKHIDAATENEPWELLDEVAPKELQRLRQIVEGLRFMAGESGIRDVNPIQTWYKPKAQRKTAFRLAAHVARGATERRLAKSTTEIKQALVAISSLINLYARFKENEVAPWPPIEILITITIEDVADWPFIVDENKDSIRAAIGFGRNLTLVPLINGIAIDHLTVGGVDTLFPQKGLAQAWLEQEGIAVLDDIRARAFTAVIDPLVEISGIKQFGYGAKDRPLLEQEALTSAYVGLENSLRHLRDLLASSPEILVLIEELVEQASSGEILFAADMASILHGEVLPCFVLVLTIQNLLLRLDIAETLSK
jgi:hypothetical protein